MQISHACGEAHPAFVTAERFDILDGAWRANGAMDVFDYEPGWGMPSFKDQEALRTILAVEGQPT